MGVKKTFLLVILNVFTRIMMCPSSTLTYTMLSAAISPFKLSSYKKQISRIYRYFLLDFEKKFVFLNSEHPYCLNPVIMLGKKNWAQSVQPFLLLLDTNKQAKTITYRCVQYFPSLIH